MLKVFDVEAHRGRPVTAKDLLREPVVVAANFYQCRAVKGQHQGPQRPLRQPALVLHRFLEVQERRSDGGDHAGSVREQVLWPFGRVSP
jgi:hypothetical protein